MSTIFDDGHVKIGNGLIGAEEDVAAFDGMIQIRDFEGSVRDRANQRVQRRIRLKTVPLNANQPTITIAGIHPETFVESFTRSRLSGGYTHVVKGAFKAIDLHSRFPTEIVSVDDSSR